MPGLKNKAMKHKGNRVYIHIVVAAPYWAPDREPRLSRGDGRKVKVGTWMRAKGRNPYGAGLVMADLVDVRPCLCGMHACDTLDDAKYYTGGLGVGDTVCLVELKGNVQFRTENGLWCATDKYVALYRKVVAMRTVKNRNEGIWLDRNADNNTKIRKWILRQYKKG